MPDALMLLLGFIAFLVCVGHAWRGCCPSADELLAARSRAPRHPHA